MVRSGVSQLHAGVCRKLLHQPLARFHECRGPGQSNNEAVMCDFGRGNNANAALASKTLCKSSRRLLPSIAFGRPLGLAESTHWPGLWFCTGYSALVATARPWNPRQDHHPKRPQKVLMGGNQVCIKGLAAQVGSQSKPPSTLVPSNSLLPTCCVSVTLGLIPLIELVVVSSPRISL
ncbi:hypothetical protein VTN96DRAFT_2889 [Rasamsonia emersonii]